MKTSDNINKEEQKKNFEEKCQQTEKPATKDYVFNLFSKNNVVSMVVAVIAIGFLAGISYHECKQCFTKLNLYKNDNKNYRRYWVYGRNVESGYLKNVFTVLERLGYKNEPNSTDWELLWAHDYPFTTLQSRLQNLKPHQLVNKYPGSGYITNKVDLATTGLKYVPRAFRLPNDKKRLINFAKDNPQIQFVQKSNDHRNIVIRKIEDINLDFEGTFIQEYVDKPLLVSGYKFDIGIYTVITSVQPLRVYIYIGDALLRFCPVKYYPFDANNIDKYVVGDDYLPTWEVPALSYVYNTLGFGMKESLNSYLKYRGKSSFSIWDQIEDAIRTVILAKEPQIISVVNRYSSKRNFFEMMRFDFVVTEDLKVYLMEANMSPNLSSAHFPANQQLFEQIIFNLLGLVGIAHKTQPSYQRLTTLQQMQVADKNIVVYPTECDSQLCRSSCISPICQLCLPCMSIETKEILKKAYLEQINRGSFKRIFPPPLQISNTDREENIEEYSPENQLHWQWFQGKCFLDSSWCV